MNLHRAMLVAPLALMAGGCQTWGPTWSEVSGARYNVTIVNRQPAVIENIDGKSDVATRPIKIEPGRHEIVIAGVPQRPTPGGGDLRKFTLDAEPCKLYYINAQYSNKLGVDYAPVIDYVEPIAGCRVPG